MIDEFIVKAISKLRQEGKIPSATWVMFEVLNWVHDEDLQEAEMDIIDLSEKILYWLRDKEGLDYFNY